MAVLTAVVGIGQTKYEAKRLDVSMPGLVREAAERALADAGCSWRDIDAVINEKRDIENGTKHTRLLEKFKAGTAFIPQLDHRHAARNRAAHNVGQITPRTERRIGDKINGKIEIPAHYFFPGTGL